MIQNHYNSIKYKINPEVTFPNLLTLYFISGFKIRVHGSKNNNTYISKSKQKRKITIRYKKGSVDNTVFIDDNFEGKINLTIQGSNNKIFIGQNVKLSDSKIAIYQNNSLISIGNDVSIGKNNQIELSEFNYSPSLTIGDDCMISHNVIIRLSDAHPVYNLSNERTNIGRDLSIGKHVWIGHDTIILKSVSIGDGCIIGTNSTITKNIPNYSIAAGIPGQVIRTGDFYWSRTEDEDHIKTAKSFYPMTKN